MCASDELFRAADSPRIEDILRSSPAEHVVAVGAADEVDVESRVQCGQALYAAISGSLANLSAHPAPYC